MPRKRTGPVGRFRTFMHHLHGFIAQLTDHSIPDHEKRFPPWAYTFPTEQAAKGVRSEFYRYRAKLRREGKLPPDLECIVLTRDGKTLWATHIEYDPEYIDTLGGPDYDLMPPLEQPKVDLRRPKK